MRSSSSVPGVVVLFALWAAVLCCCAGAGVVAAAEQQAKVVEEEFHMRPGVEEQEARLASEEAGVQCSFKYRCSGGTGENWKIGIMPVGDNHYVCNVGRPNPPSYLLTSHFTLTVGPVDESSTAVKLVSADVRGGGKVVPGAQYVVDVEQSQVRPSDSWGGSLEQITAEVQVEKKVVKKKKAAKKKAAKNSQREEL